MPRVMLALLFAVLAFAVSGVRSDVYKYRDAKGNTYFTDAPLNGARFRLEWKRESRGLVDENRKRLAGLGRIPYFSQSSSAGQTPSQNRSVAIRRARFERLINVYARLYGLNPQLLHAVIRTESGYNHEAVSHAGAQGLMQLMPGTATRYGVTNSFNPVENLRGGAAYLRDLLNLFDQDLKLALAGYNAGENAVIRNGYQIPPYAETQNYVRQVLQRLGSEPGAGG